MRCVVAAVLFGASAPAVSDSGRRGGRLHPRWLAVRRRGDGGAAGDTASPTDASVIAAWRESPHRGRRRGRRDRTGAAGGWPCPHTGRHGVAAAQSGIGRHRAARRRRVPRAHRLTCGARHDPGRDGRHRARMVAPELRLGALVVWRLRLLGGRQLRHRRARRAGAAPHHDGQGPGRRHRQSRHWLARRRIAVDRLGRRGARHWCARRRTVDHAVGRRRPRPRRRSGAADLRRRTVRRRGGRVDRARRTGDVHQVAHWCWPWWVSPR